MWRKFRFKKSHNNSSFFVSNQFFLLLLLLPKREDRTLLIFGRKKPPPEYEKRENPMYHETFLNVFPKTKTLNLKPFFRGGVTRSSVLGGGVEDAFVRAQK